MPRAAEYCSTHILVAGERIVLHRAPARGESPCLAKNAHAEQCEDCGDDTGDLVWDGAAFVCGCGARYEIRDGGFTEE